MNAFAHIRNRLGITQAAFAAGIGVTQGAISQYERGEIVPKPPVASRVVAYARSLGHTVTFDEIYASDTSHACEHKEAA